MKFIKNIETDFIDNYQLPFQEEKFRFKMKLVK